MVDVRMAFIETIPEDAATGETAAIYDADRATLGFLPNFTRAFSLRPDAYRAWKNLNVTVRDHMDLRRYELATVAAARALRSSYCSLAHGKILRDRFQAGDAAAAIATGQAAEVLDETDLAVVELAEQVARDATAVTQAHIDRLRELGLSDADIADVVMAAAMRAFFSKTLDALGAEPDARYADELEPELLEALTVGRAVARA